MTVHLLPTGWVRIPLNLLITIEHGFAFRSEAFSASGLYAVTTPGNFYEEGGFRNVGSKQRYYDGNFPQGYILQTSDLIVAMTEQSDGLLGSAALVPDKGIYLHNQRIGKVRIKRRTELSPNFLFWVFNSRYFRAAVNQTAAGTKVRHTSPSKLTSIDVLIPQIDEQQRIANALQDADSLIATLENAIAKKQAIKLGMMQQLLTGGTRLPGFTNTWTLRRLSDLLSYEQPSLFLVKTSKQLTTGHVPVLTAGKTFILGYTNEPDGIYKSHPVIIFDDFTTDSKYVDFDFKAKSSAMKILSKKSGVDLRFIYERMQLIDFPISDHKRYWISEYSKQELLVPDEHEQVAISTIIADASAEIETLRSRLQKARSIKQGMMQELLTGRTRLPIAGASS